MEARRQTTLFCGPAKQLRGVLEHGGPTMKTTKTNYVVAKLLNTLGRNVVQINSDAKRGTTTKSDAFLTFHFLFPARRLRFHKRTTASQEEVMRDDTPPKLIASPPPRCLIQSARIRGTRTSLIRIF